MIAMSEIVDLWFSMVGVMRKGPKQQEQTFGDRVVIEDERREEGGSFFNLKNQSIDTCDYYFEEDDSLLSAKAGANDVVVRHPNNDPPCKQDVVPRSNSSAVELSFLVLTHFLRSKLETF